jgi:hypothetical protein
MVKWIVPFLVLPYVAVATWAQSAVPVRVDNFIRAESDKYFERGFMGSSLLRHKEAVTFFGRVNFAIYRNCR